MGMHYTDAYMSSENVKDALSRPPFHAYMRPDYVTSNIWDGVRRQEESLAIGQSYHLDSEIFIWLHLKLQRRQNGDLFWDTSPLGREQADCLPWKHHKNHRETKLIELLFLYFSSSNQTAQRWSVSTFQDILVSSDMSSLRYNVTMHLAVLAWLWGSLRHKIEKDWGPP